MTKTSSFSALRFSSIRLLMLSLFVAQTSNQMQLVTINWHMYEQTHSPFNLGLLGLSGFLPIVMLSLISGTLVDTFNKKNVLTVAQVFLAFNSFILFFATIFQSMSPGVLYTIFALNAVIATFSLPARQSLLPAAVPKGYFLNAVSISNTVWQITVILGPSIAGFLIALFGPQSVYLTSCFGFVISMIILLFMPLVSKQEGKVSMSFSAIKEGLHFVFKNPLIYSSMLVDFFATFFASASTLMPIFAKDILHVGPQGLGFLYAAPAVGALLTGVFLSSKHTLRNQGKLLLGAVFIYGLATVVFGFSKIFFLSLVFLGITGAADMLSSVIRHTVRQINTPHFLQGRITAINMNFFVGGPYLGEIEAGIAATILGTPLSVALGGVGTIVFTFFTALLVPKLLQYKGHDVQV